MTNLHETLDILKRARAILEANYIRWAVSNGAGGYCAIGALGVAGHSNPWHFDRSEPEYVAICEAATALHPELAGAVRDRPDGASDRFDDCPIIFVNNHLGKESTLRVWDVTIAELELRLAAAEQQESPAEVPVLV